MRLFPTSEYVIVQTALLLLTKTLLIYVLCQTNKCNWLIPNLWRISAKIFMAVIVAEKKAFGRSNTS